jgi:hypothetical protein
MWEEWVDSDHLPLKLCQISDPRLLSFGRFLVHVIIEGCPVVCAIREVFGPYRPSHFLVHTLIALTRMFLERLDPPAVFRAMSDLFKDGWLYDCFPDTTSKTAFISIELFMDIFPFLGIRFGFEQLLSHPGPRASPLLTYYTSQKPAINSLRYTKAITAPLFQHVYNLIQKDEIIPVLVIPQSVCDEITLLWETHKQVFQDAFSFAQEAQMKLLDEMTKYWMERGFEPKGFCYMCIAQMANVELFDEILVSILLERSSFASKCREALLLELNALVVSLMDGDPPAFSDEPLSVERTLPAEA